MLSCFDFNMESEQGQLIASVNKAKPTSNQVKAVDFTLISQLLEIKADVGASDLTAEHEQEFITKYEEQIKPEREQSSKMKDERI